MNWFTKSSNPLAERAKSPFYGSFIISWLIWNWRIVLTVFFYKVKNYNGLSITDVIATKYLNIYSCIWIPLFMSAFFLLILPWVDYLIIWYSEINKRKKVAKQLEVSGRYSIDGSIYNDLVQKYDEERRKTGIAETDIKTAKEDLKKSKEIVFEQKNKIDEFGRDRQQLIAKTSEIEDRLSKLQNRGDLTKFFKGRWTRSYQTNANGMGAPKEQEIEIRNYEYYILIGTQMQKEYDLMLIDFDPDSEKLNFVRIKEGGSPITSELRIINENRLEGKENRTISVFYTRSKLDLTKVSDK